MLSALMVHIYHLHIAMPAEVEAQRKSVLVCMDVLERLSELWLVGKMVHDLFERVLAFDGFDLRLKANQRIIDMESHLKGLAVNDRCTSGSRRSETVYKSLPLTPSLVAHMDAALKSATTPNPAEPSHHNSTGTPRHDRVGEHRSVWMDPEPLPMPAASGTSAAEW
jgi:hypothetical protein